MLKRDNGDNMETVIGPSVQVEGNFVANGDIIIEGIVAGSIKTEKTLRVGKDAKIFADITAASAMIAGEVQGNIRVETNLELTATSKVFGDVKTKTISIAPGAVLRGQCLAGDDRKTKLEKIEERERQEKAKIKIEETKTRVPEKIK